MKLYYEKDPGVFTPISEVTEILTTEADSEEIDQEYISLTDEAFASFEFDPPRKDKRIWARIMMMPRYKATEWLFPRKKRRGSMRRRRKIWNL